MSDFTFYFDKSFLAGSALGFTAYYGASKLQRIPAVRRPWHAIGSILGTAIFVQAYSCLQESMKEDLIRRQRQFVAERQKSYIGDKSLEKSRHDLFYEELVKSLEQENAQRAK